MHRKSRGEPGSLENLGLAGQPVALSPRALPPVSSPLRYEEEVVLRATAENEFVVLKKVSDASLMASHYLLDTGCSGMGPPAKVKSIQVWWQGTPVSWQMEVA